MNEPRLEITPGMRQFLEYPRFGAQTRVLILTTDYFFDQSWQRAAVSLGWGVRLVSSAMTGGLTRDQIQQLFTAIAEFKPDFILTSNYAGMDVAGIFSRFFEDARLPYVSWFTDTPRMILYGRAMHFSPYSVAASWERGYLPHLQTLGFQHVHWMPLATDPQRFQGAPVPAPARGLAFVGNSMRPLAAEAIEKHAHLPHVLLALEEAFTAGRVHRTTFIEGLEHIFAPGLLSGLDLTERRNLELLVNYEATRRERETLVLALEEYGLELRGDPAWKSVYPRVEGPIDYFEGLAEYYRETTVNLNSTSLQMPFAVNQRVFDAPAAGGFVLTDAQADLELLFEPGEMERYANLEELREKAQFYLRQPEARLPILMRGQRRVLAQHTHAHRLQALDTYLRGIFA